jgi:hypothetical protein
MQNTNEINQNERYLPSGDTRQSEIGIVPSAALIGVACILVAFWALRGLDETYGKDLDYIEPV